MAWQDRILLHGTASTPTRADSVEERLADMPEPLPRRQRQHTAAILAITAAFLFSLAVMVSTGRAGGGAGVVLDDEDGALSVEKKCGPTHETDVGGFDHGTAQVVSKRRYVQGVALPGVWATSQHKMNWLSPRGVRGLRFSSGVLLHPLHESSVHLDEQRLSD